MSLDMLHTDPITGNMVVLDTRVHDIATRIQTGDATYGWHGDPDMFVVWDDKNELYLVYRQISAETAVLIVDVSPDAFDGRVLKLLAEGDTRFHNVLDEVEAHNARIDRQAASDDQTLQSELDDIQNFIAKQYATGGDQYSKQEARWVKQDTRHWDKKVE